ncbi:AraC family transcriptional regulator [Bradyrhizobium sp. BRP22]|uniref:AraC family transcriptional regulator n=1 Tax=Bradyrhizobium sp. BRP22 TaxID=2793821 RepID=UPI001CD66385|nr:AraC family transcriptional regulator [Bradyrhizobium sp. BRP22]
MAGELTHVSMGSLGISTGSFSRGLRSRGVVSPHRWLLGIALAAPARHHLDVQPGQILALAPGTEQYSIYSGANSYAGVLIEPDELFGFLGHEPGARDDAMWRQPVTAQLEDPARDAATVRAFATLFKTIVDHGATMSAEAVDYYKRCILELMTAPMIRGVGYRGPWLPSAVELVHKVDRFLIDAGTRPVHISELSAEFGVPRRTLHRAFAEVLNMPPKQFLRYKRLGDVHDALLTAGPGATVQSVAREHGFLHGRFANEYSRLFGEPPLRTLRRSPFAAL